MSGKEPSKGKQFINPATYNDEKFVFMKKASEASSVLLQEFLNHRVRQGRAITYIDEDGYHVVEDSQGTRPFLDGEKLTEPPSCTEYEIRELAFLERVRENDDDLNKWSEAISSNAGEDIQSDEIELLLIRLRRMGKVGGKKLTQLHARISKSFRQVRPDVSPSDGERPILTIVVGPLGVVKST